jgi:ribosome-associated protein
MDDIEVGDLTIPAGDLEETFDTSGGPGGQHANRNETAVRLRLDVLASSLPEDVKHKLVGKLGETIEVSASESRSQFRNRALARRQLRDKIDKALQEQPKRRATRLTRASKKRRVAEKRARAETKRLRQPPSPND